MLGRSRRLLPLAFAALLSPDLAARATATEVDAGGLRARLSEDPWRVVFVDAEGDVGAGKVELDYPQVRFVDYFTLLRIQGEWKIVNKVFARFPR